MAIVEVLHSRGHHSHVAWLRAGQADRRRKACGVVVWLDQLQPSWPTSLSALAAEVECSA